MTDTLALSAPTSTAVHSAEAVSLGRAGSAGQHVDAGAVRASVAHSERHHSLMDLEREREPSYEQLLSERYPDSPGFFTSFGYWVMERIAEDVAAHRVRAGIECHR